MKKTTLPKFIYHPDPVGSGVFQTSEKACQCCRARRGFIYGGPVNAEDGLDEALCPWCLFDGSAAEQLGASFNDTHVLRSAGIDQKVCAEIEFRTPGYVSWQGESWLAHCNDACEFHGDASVQEVENASPEARTSILAEVENDGDWGTLTRGYEPGGSPAFYKFVCRHCGSVQLAWDCD